ncbi:GNAT family N-acetyltransferase [Streptomyces sp. NBC_01304]|uniref:GNAT family N-acetyltransferase n=1 Tax=Streptomyces sp. NBC_01304 TaxID=2903818 RepID=UPI002E0EB261|nr:GNAT family N-acetyltransferase [Streptomyces sp. NBC_01304]
MNITFRTAVDSPADLAALVGLYDAAARWMIEQGIDQWKPGEKDEEHFRRWIKEGEVWLAEAEGDEQPVGAWELWWDDVPAWGEQPPVAGYVHRLMVRRGAPAGTGRAMLAQAERRIAEAGRQWCRLDCVSTNARLRDYYEGSGYTVVGEQPFKVGAGGSKYSVTLLEKRLA